MGHNNMRQHNIRSGEVRARPNIMGLNIVGAHNIGHD